MILDENPEIRARAEAGEALFGTIDSWLVYKLTRGAAHVTDVTNASRTMLFDIHRLDWSDELLGDLGIPRAMLPRVVDSSGWAADIAEGEFEGTAPICGIAGDQHASLFGQLCFEPGEAKNTIGTGSFLLMNTGSRPRISEGGLLATVGWKAGSELVLCLGGFGVRFWFSRAMAARWARDHRELGGYRAPPRHRGRFGRGGLRAGAGWTRSAALGSDRAGRHLWDRPGDDGRASRARHDRGDRLAGDGACRSHAIRDCIAVSTLKIDGGAAANDRLLQLHADLIGVKIVRPEVLETTALGAAYLAGLGDWFLVEPR